MLINPYEKIRISFEPVAEYDFHEKPVALQALGSYVAQHRKDHKLAKSAAKLACELATLKHTEGPDNTKISTEDFELTDGDLEILIGALHSYVETTEIDVQANAFAGNLHGCSVRFVESEIASAMVEKLATHTDLTVTRMHQHFNTGFASPNAYQPS